MLNALAKCSGSSVSCELRRSKRSVTKSSEGCVSDNSAARQGRSWFANLIFSRRGTALEASSLRGFHGSPRVSLTLGCKADTGGSPPKLGEAVHDPTDQRSGAPTVPLMPAAFLGHGSPMNALETNHFSKAWQAFGVSVPRPRAILVISAHWYTTVTAVTAMPHPRTIHDFYGFPKALFDVEYPAPGDPAVAEEIADVVKPVVVGLDGDSWGLDHGAWSVLVHAFPKADVPVLQLSIDTRQRFEYHLDLGARLQKLRERSVLVLGSGNVVHNLRAVDWSQPDQGFDWARRFDDAAREILTDRPGEILRLQEHPDFRRAVPTPDHFLPAVYLAGLAAGEGRPARVLVDGYAYGSLSMTAYVLDVDRRKGMQDPHPGAGLPDPAIVPAEDTNT